MKKNANRFSLITGFPGLPMNLAGAGWFLVSFLCIHGCSSIWNPATGKQEPVFTPSEANEEKSGRAISKKIEKEFKSVDNYSLQSKVQAIGRKLAGVSDRKDLAYHFEVLDNKEVNAFALPGGYVYVFKGVTNNSSSDDELASVLAHEIGHITARHTAKRVRGSIGLNALALLLIKIESGAEAKQEAYRALSELMLHYSREDELEADRLAVKYMKAAGFDPNAIITFLKKLRKIEYEKPIQQPRIFKTHPYLADRIKTVKEEINGIIEFEDYINANDK